VAKCPYCGYEGRFEKHEPWPFRFYDVKIFYSPKYKGALNYPRGVLALGQKKGFRVSLEDRFR